MRPRSGKSAMDTTKAPEGWRNPRPDGLHRVATNRPALRALEIGQFLITPIMLCRTLSNRRRQKAYGIAQFLMSRSDSLTVARGFSPWNWREIVARRGATPEPVRPRFVRFTFPSRNGLNDTNPLKTSRNLPAAMDLNTILGFEGSA